jgi:hypothetical protein
MIVRQRNHKEIMGRWIAQCIVKYKHGSKPRLCRISVQRTVKRYMTDGSARNYMEADEKQ